MDGRVGSERGPAAAAAAAAAAAQTSASCRCWQTLIAP